MKIILVALLACGSSFAAGKAKKAQPPKMDLASRYSRLACAVVQVLHESGAGTGFFISQNGDVLTAAHVALDRKFSQGDSGEISVEVDYKRGLRLNTHGSVPATFQLPKLTDADVQRSMSDLAILRTGITPPCFLKINEAGPLPVGAHVIAMGYPVSAPTGALYEGFVSARYPHLPIPVAVVNNIPIFPTYDVIRIQMPITPGASGGPVIADNDTVIGVVVENPTVWFNDLNALIEFGQKADGGFNAPTSDLPKVVAKLAWVVQQFVTSGAGLAVPVSYLKVPEPKVMPPETPTIAGPALQQHHGWFRSLLDRLK